MSGMQTNGAFARDAGFPVDQFNPMAQRRAGDTNRYVFVEDAVYNEAKSREHGYAIYEEAILLEIHSPGDMKSVPVHRVSKDPNDHYKLKYPKEWAAFQDGREYVGEGLPLEQWPLVRKAQVKTLKGLGVHLVEHLAGLTDGQCQQVQFIGIVLLRDKAKAFLESAKSAEPLNKVMELADQQKKDIALFQSQIAAQAQQIADLQRRMGEVPTIRSGGMPLDQITQVADLPPAAPKRLIPKRTAPDAA